MLSTVASASSLGRLAVSLSDRVFVFAGLGAAILLAGIASPGEWTGSVLIVAGGTLLSIAALVQTFAVSYRARRDAFLEDISEFIQNDASPTFTTDFDGVILRSNSAALERFGAQAGETLTNAVRNYFANPSAALLRLRNRAHTHGSAREDVVTRRGPVRLSVHEVRDGHLLWRLEEMTERGPVTSARGAETLSLPMITASQTGAILFMNDAMRRILGGREKSLHAVFKHLPLRNDSENTILGVDGPVRARVIEIEGQGGRREIFLLPIGTQPVSADGAVLRSDSVLLEELPVALLKMDDRSSIQVANRLARELLGEDAKPGVPVWQLVEGLGRSVRDWLEDGLSEGRSLPKPEVVRARRNDRDVFLQITLGRFRDEDGAGLIAVLSDATELKTLEAQFVQSQKMQAIGQLAGGVAHDFNNLLTAISGHCDLLLLRHDQGDLDYGDLIQINQNANRAASLVGQLLAFSRKQNLQPEVLDLRETLGDLIHLLNRLVGEKITLSLSHDQNLKPIRADKRQFEQVLMNLVVNARDAMLDGGEIRIETEIEHLDEELRRDRAVVPPGNYVLVKVIDEGVGIPSDKLAKIFEPFFTTKRAGEGTGLGLSTAYGIVKQTGGYIFVDSVEGQGTTFKLLFPIHEINEPVKPVEKVIELDTRIEMAEGVILLVEDEAPVRAFASRALRLRGFTVLEAESAEDALALLEDPAIEVDVFVTDVIMPGLNGPSWVKKALKTRPGVKVVFVSGYAEESFTEDQATIPNSVFLPKPFSLRELTATVHDQIH